MASNVDKINLALISAVAAAMIWMFTTFVKAEEHKDEHNDLDVSIAYGQYYDRLDDFDEAEDEENADLAREYKHEMERLKAIICEHDPEWERCKPG